MPRFKVMPERMTRWSPKQIFALLLAVFVTAGLSLTAVQASDMSVKMTMMSGSGMTMPSDTGTTTMSDMGVTGGGDCDACAGGTRDHGYPMSCWPVCVAPVFAVLPQGLAVTTIGQMAQLYSSTFQLLRGRDSLPDPSPPRPSDLV